MLMADDVTERKISRAYKVACNKLTPSDLGKLKFLLSDKLNVNALFNAKEASDVFQLCESQHRTLDFLSGLLQLLKRNDILSQIDSTRSTTLSHSSMMPSSKHNLVQSPLISNRRLFLFLLVDEKQLHKRNLSCLVLFHSLNSDFADCEWPYVIEKLLHTKLLDEDADEAAVREWTRNYIDSAIEGECAGADQLSGRPPVSYPGRADQSDQVDSTQEPAEQSSSDDSCCSIDRVNQSVMRDSYNPDAMLGKGRSAVVYRGSCHESLQGKYGQLEVAVKVLNIEGTLEENWNKQFLRELLATHALRSPYLLPLLCYTASHSPQEKASVRFVCEREQFYALMFPLMSGGNLFKRLFEDKPQSVRGPLTWFSRVRLAYQIAAGLQAMHSRVPGHRQPIVHRDIKSENILLDEYDNARLADTGLSHELLQGRSYCTTTYGGTLGYSHPDAGHGHYYMHYDWFSFGIVLLELVLKKPARSRSGTLQCEMKQAQSKLKYLAHELDKRPEVQDLLNECWTKNKESQNAAYRLLYVALHCIAPMDDKFDDIYRKKFLGLNNSCWTELTPVTLLKDLCTRHKISLYAFPKEDSAEPGNCNKRRCAACFIFINEDAGGVHTRSASCQPDKCLWYCFACMRSKEPIVCLKHGSAQPIIGGKNAYVIEVFGDGEGAEIFQQDCERLKATLTDYRFAGLSENNVFAIAKSGKDEVRLTLLQIILQLEKQYIEAACSRVLHNLLLDEHHRKNVLESVVKVCDCLRKKRAINRCAKRSIYLANGNGAQKLSKIKTKSLVTKLVDLAWSRTRSSELDFKQRASQILAMFDLWTGDNPDDSVRCVREDEKKELENLASKYSLKWSDLAILMDKCFTELMSNYCCLPVHVQALSDQEKERCVAGLRLNIEDKQLLRAYEDILSSLLPLSDGLIWYHYCGHATGIDDDSLDDRVLPRALLQAAGRLVASLVVSLDCCYAEANKPSIQFDVDDREPYSSYTVLSSCTSREKSYYSNSTAFTGFLVCGLLGAFDDCRSAFERCFRGDACNSSDCIACNSYKEKEVQCKICSEYRSASSGIRTLVDVFEYAKAHICTSRMHPVITTTSAVKRVPPVVYSHTKPPTYNVRLDLPVDGQPYQRKEFTVEFKQLPRKLSQIRLELLHKALLSLKSDGESLGKPTRSAAACLLVGCDVRDCISEKCIDSALRLIEAMKRASQLVTSVSASNAQEHAYKYYSHFNGQAVDNGDAPEASNEVVSAYCCTTTGEPFAKVCSSMSFYTVVEKISSDADLQKSFRRGFDVLCIMDM